MQKPQRIGGNAVMEKHNLYPLSQSVEEMFIGPFGSSLKNDSFVSVDDAYCIVYEQKHAIKKTMDVETRYVDRNKYEELKRFNIKGGDIIVSCRGTIGETFVVPDDSPLGIMHPSIMKIRLKRDIYDKNYFNLLLSNYLKKHEEEANGTGIKMAISAKELGKSLFPVPSLKEQQEIFAIFSKIDTLINERKEQLEKLDKLVKARFVEFFGDVANSPKYSGVPLGTICSTLSGGTPTTKVPEYYQGDIPWISTPYLGNNHINGSSAKAYITEDAIKNSATHLIPANTIMFGIRVGVGKSSIIDEPMCANQDIVALMGIDTNKYNLLFVKHTLDSYQNHFDSIKKGATILGITTDDLKKVLIPNVDIGLQNQFAAFVEQTDKSKLEVQKGLEKLELLKKALMQKYFG